MFGEYVHVNFQRLEESCQKADLLLVIGTSLNVPPVNKIPSMVRCPTVLVNQVHIDGFDHEYLGTCDSFSEAMVDKLGYKT